MSRARLAFAAMAALAGCVASPKHVDPFASLNADPNRRYDLTAGLLLSENTVKAADYLSRFIRGASRTDFGLTNGAATEKYADDAVAAFTQYSDVLQKRFARVVRIERQDQGTSKGADVIALLDVSVKHAWTPWTDYTADAQLVLLSPDGRVIETVKGAGAQTNGNRREDVIWPSVIGDSADKIDAGLSASVGLAQFEAALGRTTAASGAVYSSDVDKPSYQSAQNPDNFALIVGIEKYSGLPEARFAERDAAAVKAHLAALGYPERNIRTLAGPQATRAALAKDLEAWLPREVSDRSTVFVYYSGHGSPDTRTGQAYLLPWDADAKFLDQTAYPLKRLYQNLNALRAKKVVVAIDACFSGGGGRSVLPLGTRPLVNKIDTASEQAGSAIVFAAAAGDEITGTIEAQGHGLFTYYFLKGLNGAAADDSGRVTVKALYDYLVPKVRDGAGRDNRDQVPQLLSASLGADSLVRLR